MRAWLASLEPRERYTLMAGAAGAAVIVLWAFVWMPLARGTSELGASIQNKRQLVVDVQRAAAIDTSQSDSERARGSGRSLVVIVDETARTSGLGRSFTATRPDGRNDINVRFQNAPFDSIVEWLLELDRDYGVSVESGSFSEASERGLVSGQILLRRG